MSVAPLHRVWLVGLVLSAIFATAPSRADDPSERIDSREAPRETTTEPPPANPPASPSPACAVAGPACFAGCPAESVRTAGDQCVPKAPRERATKTRRELSIEPSEPPSQAPDPPSAGDVTRTEKTEQSSDRPCCFVWLTVDAVGLKNLGNRVTKKPVHVDVLINGQLLGTTPLTDGLPPGDYHVEVKTPGGTARSAVVQLRPEQHRKVTAELLLRLDPAERQSREAYRQARLAQAQRPSAADPTESRTERVAPELDPAAPLRAWERETDRLYEERARRRTIGWFLLGTGFTLAGIGGALEVVAQDSNDEAHSAEANWRRTSSADLREEYARRAREMERKRNRQHAMGLTGLGLGAAGMVAGTVLLVSAPNIPALPGIDTAHTRHDAGDRVTGALQVLPWVSAEGAGSVVRWTP